MKFSLFIVIFLLFISAVGAWFLWNCEDDWCFVFERQKIKAADSFERCAGLGFPVMESYPRRCRAGDKTFTETVQPIVHPLIRVATPLPDAIIQSPLAIKGEARGNWYFEASFPVRLLDGNGNNVSLDPPYVMTAAEWMTTEFVPFETTHTFSAPATETGILILQKDNPSGLPEHDDSVSIPVRFK